MNCFMSSLKIVIPIFVAIAIVVVIFNLTQTEITEEQTPTQFKETNEVGNMLEKIKEDKIINDNSENPYFPKDREWIESGPFQIDRSEYVLGEKIFVNIINLPKNVKGEMIFSKIINSTHSYEYKKMQFDGSKLQQNFYLGFTLNPARGLCTADMLIGNWELIFDETVYESLKFKVKNQIIPGMEKQYKPVC